MTVVYIIRHGETVDNRNRVIQGQKDSALTEEGKISVRDKAKSLKNIKFDTFFCSPIGRAKNSLNIILDELKLNPDIVYLDELMEMDFGKYTKMEVDKVKDIIVEHKKNSSVPYPGGESGDMLKERSLNFIDKYILPNSEKCFLVVTHYGVLEVILKHYFKLTYKEIQTDCRNIVRLCFDGREINYSWIK